MLTQGFGENTFSSYLNKKFLNDMNDTGIKCEYRATQHFDQEEANVIIEGMLALGYNAFAIWPGHPVSVNVTVTELVNQGIPVILIAGPAELPTDASLCIATDVKVSAMKATENLIKAMGGFGWKYINKC